MQKVDLGLYNNIKAQNVNKVLQNGSQVLVRIAEQIGNNKYLGYVSGVKVNIYSNLTYSKGDIFKANIFVKDGVLTLQTKQAQNLTVESKALLQNLTQVSENQINQNQISTELFSYLQNIGMVPDNLSKMILQQMKNLGLKYDSILMNQIYKEAKKYKGKEKLALELIMNLIQKGVSFDSDEIQTVLDSLENNQNDNQNDNQTEKKDNQNFSTINDNLTSKQIKDFCINVFNCFFMNQPGLLSVSNSLKTRKDLQNNASWILFPYEVKQGENTISNGKFRLLLQDKKLIKFCVQSNQQENETLYVLEYKNNICSSIKVANKNSKEEENQIINQLNKKIIDCGLDINVMQDDWNRLCNNCFGDEDVLILNGEV